MGALEGLLRDPRGCDVALRVLHTIKGNAGMLQLPPITLTAHATEALLQSLRRGQRPLDEEALMAVRGALGVLMRMLDDLDTGIRLTLPPAKLLALLERLAAGERDGERTREVVASARRLADSTRRMVRQDAARRSTRSIAYARVQVPLLDRLRKDTEALAGPLDALRRRAALDPTLEVISAELDQLVCSIGDGLRRAQQRPIGRIWAPLESMTRSLAHELGKRVQLVTRGDATMIASQQADALRDAITQLIRNACDHGIESPAERAALGKAERGTIELSACYEGDQLRVEVRDDGRGVDVDVLRERARVRGLKSGDELARADHQQLLELLFQPGFSTREQASDVSGRGVGMDLVLERISEIGGSVELASTPGAGTICTLRISPPGGAPSTQD